MIKDKLCIKGKICKKTDLNKLVLAAHGCPHHASCEDFVEIKEKIKDKIVSIRLQCSIERCYRDSRTRIANDCLDCKNIKLSDESNSKIDVHFRCVHEYCFIGKNSLDVNCTDCIECRLLNTNRQAWVSFRGGKDIKGRNL